jgi:hypothetical protein
MITPKEQAQNLVNDFYIFNHIGDRHAIICALKTLERIMDSNSDFAFSGNMWGPNGSLSYEDSEKFWLEVKEELLKM